VARGGYTRDHGNPDMQRPTLEGVAEEWMPKWGPPRTATVDGHWTTLCADDTGMREGRTSQGGTLLSTQAGLHQVQAWPTPATRDYRGENSEEHVTTNGTGRMHMDQLPNFVAHGSHCARPDPQTAAGETSSSVRRTLNPLFVEWLMGWPIGWTDCERPVTGFSHWLRRGRGVLSTLCSEPEAPAQGLML